MEKITHHLADLIAAYHAAKAAGIAADDPDADAAGKVWIDAFYRVAECPCRSIADVQAKAALMVEVITNNDMTIDDAEALMVFRSMVEGFASCAP